MLTTVARRSAVRKVVNSSVRAAVRQPQRTVFTKRTQLKTLSRSHTLSVSQWRPAILFYTTNASPPPNETNVQKWIRIGKEMAQFYMNGIKQLWYNRGRANQLIEKQNTLRQPLVWEEHKFVAQYYTDRLALVPFLIIWLLPGSGVTLPLVAAVFPGLLPSTLRTPSQNETARQKRLAARKALSSDLLAIFSSELAANAHMFDGAEEGVHDLTSVLHKAALGQSVTADELMPLTHVFAKYLDVDEIPSGNVAPNSAGLSKQYSSQWNNLMPAKELVQLASFVGSLSFSFVPTPSIRNSLKKLFLTIQAEDKLLAVKDTVSTLTRDQLLEECDLRGLQTAPELTDAQLRWQLSQWVRLSVSDAAVSPSLLIFFALSNVNANLDVVNQTK